jgi:GTP cyclohydrolase I
MGISAVSKQTTKAIIDQMPLQSKIELLTRDLLVAIGEDPMREGLVETPARVARFWLEFINYDPGNFDTTFETVQTDQMVIVSGIRAWSLCEHHLLPFWCDVSVGYITDERIIGLSKVGRIVHACAHKLQVQERLVTEIADKLSEITGTKNIAVVAQGEHLCMSMRGIKTPAIMTSSVMRGIFHESATSRAEFLTLAARGHVIAK